MGKVFSWDELEKGKIPRLSDFSVVANKIRHDLEACDAILGAALCGSVIWNHHNQRSDIDCVVVYNPEKRHEAISIFQEINLVASDLFVPVNLMTLDADIAKKRVHHIGFSLIAHLGCAAANGGIVKRSPVPFLAYDNALAAEDVRGYFRSRLRRFEEGLIRLSSMDDCDLVKFLQAVLEAPVHVARTVMLLTGMELVDDSKRAIVANYPNITGARELELFQRITTVDKNYTEELFVQLQHPDKARYFSAINNIKAIAPAALEFVRLNAIRFARDI